MAVCRSICAAVLLLSVVLTIAEGVKRGVPFFHRGRYYKGNLGEPATTRTIRNESAILEEYIVQELDHFTPSDTRTWKQRYLTNTEFYKKGGPMFLYISGEQDVSTVWMFEGEWIENAEIFHPLCFQLEHRFYGKSQPYPDLSTESLAYLNSEQAVADIAFFIQAMNIRYNRTDPKWVLWGGSYAGTLAAWARFEYPHLVFASVSSSGPVLAKWDFGGYYVVVRDVLEKQSKACLKAVIDGTEQIGGLLQQNSGRSQLNKIFRLCDPIDANNNNDVANFFDYLASNFAGIVQYNNDNRVTNSAYQKIEVADLCNILVNESIGAPVERLAAVNSLILDSTEIDCLDYTYKALIEYYRNASLDAPASDGDRQWFWQTCVEFGFFQTSSKVPEVFGDYFPIDFIAKQCSDVFGEKFTKKFQQNAVDRSNTIHGGLRLQASRVIYMYGSADPWHCLGILRTMHPDAPVMYTQGTAHVADMYPSSPKDPIQLTRARQMVHNYLRQWLRESDSNPNSPIEAVASPWWGFGWAQPFLNGFWNPVRFTQIIRLW